MGQCHDASPKRMRMMIRQAELKEPRGEQKGKVESGTQRPATWMRRETLVCVMMFIGFMRMAAKRGKFLGDTNNKMTGLSRTCDWRDKEGE